MKRHSPEQIVKKLQKADALRADGMTIPEACKELEVAPATYYQWQKKYRGMDIAQAKQLKNLEKENSRLKMLVADLTLDNRILQEVAEGNL